MIRKTLLFLMASCAWALAGEPLDVSSDLDGILKDTDVPGIAAVAMFHGEIVATGVAGVRKIGETPKITLQDHFHIGSCTKSMTASLAAMLVAEGKITWDTKAADVFRDVKIDPGFKDATLRQLLSNTGGAPHDVPAELWGTLSRSKLPEAEQRKMLVNGILSDKPVYVPGEGSVYSNAGFSIGGAMLERVSGQSYEELARRRLFAPLGITSAGFGTPPSPGKIDQPYGHHKVNGALVAVSQDNPPAITPAGRVNLSILDFAKYASLHLGDLKGGGPLDAKQLDDLHRPVPPSKDYGCGWKSCQRDWAGGTALTHTGTNTMFFAVMWLAPAKDFAVVVSCNSGEGEKTCDKVAWMLIGRCLPR